MKSCDCLESDQFFGHIRCAKPLDADPKEMFTLVEAYKVCEEELANPVTDWDRYADAWWTIQELEKVERPKPDKLESAQLHRDSSLLCIVMWIVMWSGLILLVGQLFFGFETPVLLVLGAGMFGLPAVIDEDHMNCAAWCLIGSIMVLMVHSAALDQAHASDKLKGRRAIIERQLNLNCIANNRIRETVDLPTINCETIVP